MKTIMKLNMELQGSKRASCQKIYDLPFRFQEGDHIKLNGQYVSDVKHIYLDPEIEEITANLEPILIEKNDKEEYNEIINLLKNLGWIVNQR